MKNKKVLFIVIIFLILILIALAGVYAYIALDIFKSPKQLFGKYLNNQIEQIQSLNTGALKTFSDNLKENTSNAELNIELEEDTKLNIGLKRDPDKSISILNLKVDSDDNNLANYSLYADKEKLAIKIPELNEKYFSVGINTLLEEVEKNLKENNITEKDIELSTESIEKYKNELKTIYNKYLEEVKVYFTDDKFSAEKNVTVDVNGKSISANRYTFSLTGTELENIIFDILSKMMDEPILSDFMTDEQISELKDNIESKKQDINDLIATKVLKVCIYEASGSTVKIELQVDDEVMAELMFVKVSDTESNLIVNQISKKVEDIEVGEEKTILYIVNTQDENTAVVTTKTSVTYDKDDIKALKKYYEDNDYYYYTDEMIDENYKNTSSTQRITIILNGERATMKISSDALDDLGYNIKSTQINYTFGSQVKLDSVDDSIELEEYVDNKEKQEELMLEVMENLQNNPNSLIGMLYGLINSYSDISLTDINDFEDDEYLEDANAMFNAENDIYRSNVENLVTDAINDCLDSYKRDLEEDDNTNISDYLTDIKISEMMVSSLVSNIELVDGSTMKLNYDDETYYVIINISGDTLEVNEVKAYTESEYEEL